MLAGNGAAGGVQRWKRVVRLRTTAKNGARGLTLSLALLCAGSATAQNVVTVDASAPVPAPQPVAAKLGTGVNPKSETIGANSQFLTKDGKPWLPVMGEFHYSRYTEAEWEPELLKMKANGVDVVSTYVIWIHHEEIEGKFDWSGQRDLRRFVELCGKHGLYVFVRIGPWAHAEARNGGFPDWVLKNGPVRQNDPVYLREVKSFYTQIGEQLRGEMWKDGGPVIGVQLENEYSARGPGKGAEHIRTLKQMAVAAGLDAPLYTVTGWDGAAIPLDAVLPVYGGYPDAPWSDSSKPLPPSEVYAFRFANRVAGNMGAIGGDGQNGASVYKGTPFLTAEVGAGMEDTYFRRPVVSADDIAAIPTVMVGSGVNLVGYYLFHGGRNPDGGAITLEESQRTGYPTDVPVRSYDFQAPLGEFGQERESARKLKLVNYFLNDFGAMLAPMATHVPAELPKSAADTKVPRVAVRSREDAGFIFFNNYVRGMKMPARAGFQVEVKLPGETLRVPEEPIELPSGAYGIWPVGLHAGTSVLRYSTAQLFKRVESKGEVWYWFFSLPGVTPEFLFAPHTAVLETSAGVERVETTMGVRVRAPESAEAVIRLAGGVHFAIVPESEAETIWELGDVGVLLRTAASAFSDGEQWTLESPGDARVPLGIFGTADVPTVKDGELRGRGGDLLFREYVASVAPVTIEPVVTKVREASPRGALPMGPKLSWRSQAIPMAPEDKDFAKAAVWTIRAPGLAWPPELADALLQITYQGDVARLYRDGKLVDDSFWNGLPWEIGLREVVAAQDATKGMQFQLRILPLPKRAPMFLEEADRLRFENGAACAVESVKVVPVYRIVLTPPAAR
ncbi:MAG TPA: beta-galactosidase [Acidobacteriaceae bacterium]|jgi:hypothetical protein|nr:beta-galactosidase [Acidobacteriaceae bacterium]